MKERHRHGGPREAGKCGACTGCQAGMQGADGSEPSPCALDASGGERCSRPALTIAIAGNPNSGKTTLFNALTGARQHVGNWPGVTVEKKQGTIDYRGRELTIVDLPGIYSLTAYSVEEIVTRDFIINECPDVIINIIDAANMERNLYLTVQLVELGVPLVVGLNMIDEAEARGIGIDIPQMETLLGAPVVPLVASRGRGVDDLLRRASEHSGVSKIRIGYGREIEAAISAIEKHIECSEGLRHCGAGPRWMALKLLERDRIVERDAFAAITGLREVRDAAIAKVETELKDDAETAIVDRRYGYVSGFVREVVTRSGIDRRTMTDRIDAVLTSKAFGLPLLFVAMWGTFQLTFTLGAFPMKWIDALFTWLGGLAHATFGPTLIGSLISDGVIGGVGGVVSFMPNILLLFFAIALLEDTGYMARAAFIMDRVMHKLNLHGKSFIPMLIGFGCSVPAIMAARTLENRRDRIVTILVTPLMSCGARLPVYVLLAGAFFSPAAAGNVIFSIYLIGILFAVGLARLFRSTLLKGDKTAFVMELPPYRMPTARSLMLHMWERAWMYLQKAGTIILAFAVVVWVLVSFPKGFPGEERMRAELAGRTAAAQRLEKTGGISASGLKKANADIQRLESEIAGLQLRNSYAGKLGLAIEPVMKPIGFDWKVSIALISGFAAKEVIVSTMGTIYSLGEGADSSNALKNEIHRDENMSPLKAYSLMLFVLLTIPCMSTLAIIRRETDSWRWPLFSVGYHLALSWLVCFAVFQIGSLFGL